MDGIERLKDLEKKRDEWFLKWHEQRVQVTKELYRILNELNKGPAPLLPLRENEIVGIDRDSYAYPDPKWKVRKEIYFVNQDPERKDRAYDFGSTFSLYITKERISLNHGSCGEWGKDDKGQLSRLYLMTAIFEHEKEIIDALDPLIDYSVCEKFREYDNEIYKINRAIEDAKELEENRAALIKIKIGKYLCSIGWRYGDKDKEGNYPKIYHFHSFEKVENITEKTITTKDNWNNMHRYKKDDIIYKVRHHSLFVVDNTEVTPSKEDESYFR